MAEPATQASDWLPESFEPGKGEGAAPAPANAPAPQEDGLSIASLLGPSPKLESDLLETQRAKVSAQGAVYDRTNQRVEEDRTLMRQAFAREGAAMNDIKPWDAKNERAKYRSDPIQDFGSFASVFAIAASAFTKTPMINALNASAAAMNAVRDRNEEEYKYAYQAWKDNTELAIKRGNMMHQQYADAAALMNVDMTIGEAKMREVAARFGDQATLTMMENGMFPEVWEKIAAKAKAVEGLQAALENTTKRDFMNRAFESDPDSKALLPNGQPDVQKQYNAFERSRSMDLKTPADQDMYKRIWANVPKGLSFEESAKWVDRQLEEYNRSKYAFRGSSDKETVDLKATQLMEEAAARGEKLSLADARLQAQAALSEAKSPGSADERTIKAKAVELMDEAEKAGKTLSYPEARLQATEILTGKKTKKTMTSIDIGMIEQKATELKHDALLNGKDMSDTEAYRQARIFIRGGKLLSDETATRMAEQWIRGDHTIFQNLGRGMQGSENVGKVWEEIGRLTQARGITPEMLIKNAAEVKGLASGEQTLYRRQANVIAAAEGFIKVAPTVTAISDKINRTRYPSINSIIVAAERGTGDENVVRMAAAINGAINTYSRAINGGTGQGYMNDKEHARQILDIAYSKGQMRAAIDQLTIEVNAELLAPGQSKEVMYDMFTGAEPLQLKTQASGGNKTLRYDSQGKLIQ